ncbi:MAG: hypothetical protein JWQ20_107 [Conexibacter sp.]|jgi:hypothetical protein|nr:hypothetical protein [Conexibacter sp.]
MQKVAIRALCAATILLALFALPSAASAATGSYTVGNTGWNQPTIYNQGILLNGTTISPPAGIPAGATITNISGQLTWQQNAPSGTYYEAFLCDTTTCAPSWHQLGQQVYGDVTTFTGEPAATTQFHVAAQIHCSCGGTFPAVSPPRYTIDKSLIVNYTY